jgi:polyferredoxin
MNMRKIAAGIIGGALLLILVASSVLLADGFGSQSNFGTTNESHTFQGPETQPSEQTSYFIHEQGLKLILLVGFSVLAMGIIVLRKYKLRRWLLLISVIVLGFVMGGFLCPVAAVQNIFLKANTGYLLLFLVPVILALFVGRLFCGYICPFGAAQELLYIRKWGWRIPSKWMRVLTKLKYVLLIYLVVRVLVTGSVILQDYSPFKPLFSWGGTPMTIGVTALFAFLSIFFYRPFCRTLCPLGAFLSLLSRFSLFRIRANTSCVSCNLCTRECPNGAMDGGTVDAGECLLCGECAGICPTSSLCIERRRSGGTRE